MPFNLAPSRLIVDGDQTELMEVSSPLKKNVTFLYIKVCMKDL